MPSASNMQSVCRAVFSDFARKRLCAPLTKDLDYLLSRIEKEGYQFMLTTLPLLGKAVERALITGDNFNCPQGWRLVRGTRLPQFLNGLLKEIFQPDGAPFYNHNGCPESVNDTVFFIRQLTLMFSKHDVICDEGLRIAALRSFKERATRAWDPPFSNEVFRDTVRVARELLERVFASDAPAVDELRGFQKKPWGRHGPGAVASSECGCEKWDRDMWPGLPSVLFAWNDLYSVPLRDVLPCQPSGRVCAVPKDFRGPRVICIEPKENQFAQQGLMALFYRILQTHVLTRRSIRFNDTKQSEELCFESNISTIDLKDASDTIHLSLARLVLPRWIFALVTRYRTRSVQILDETVRTTCLASMGNATCFPLETMIFWAIARAAMVRVTASFPYSVRGTFVQTLRVFGDDIIVPSWACDVVCEALEACGLTINRDKTCHLSLVKESCGEWTFNGKSARIVKMRASDVREVRSWLQMRDYARHFRELSYLETAASIESICDAYLPEHSLRRRFNKDLQRMEIRVPQIVTSGRTDELPNYAGLYAWQVGNDVTPSSNGARKRVKWGWVCLSSFGGK